MVLDPEQFKRMSKDGGSLKRQVDIDAIWRRLDALEKLVQLLQHPLVVSPDIPASEQPHTVPTDLDAGLYLRTGGDGTVELSQIPASEAATDTTNFDNNLSVADDTVQKALDTLDDITIGDVTGPASSVDDNIATYDGITGKLIQDGGAKISDLEVAGAAAAAVTGHESTYDHSKLHDPATVSGNGIQIVGQQVSLQIGTGATELAAGNHLHTGVYDPAGSAAGAVASHEGTYAHADIALNSGHRTTVTGNPHAVTKTDVGLGNVTNDAQLKAASNLSDVASASTSWSNLGGQNTGQVFSKFDATTAPTANDDDGDGYVAGSLWVDVTNDRAYVCLDPSTGAAVWTEITQASGTGDVVGPASATDGYYCLYDGITGKLIKVGGAPSAKEDVANKDAANGYAGLSAATKLSGSQQTYGTLANTACEGNDARLSDDRDPNAHNTTHQSGGADAIKLDDLAAPDDNTDLDASTTKHGLLKKLSGTATEFLNGSGSWATPAGAVQDKIEEGNSKVEVIDAGTGYVSIYIDGSERFRLGTSGIYDTSGNLLISFSAAASAVNYLAVSNAATGNVVRVTATGSDATVGLTLQGKGGGAVTLSGTGNSSSGSFEATGFIVSGNTGHTGTYSWLDGDGMTTRNIDISGGIITNAYNT